MGHYFLYTQYIPVQHHYTATLFIVRKLSGYTGLKYDTAAETS